MKLGHLDRGQEDASILGEIFNSIDRKFDQVDRKVEQLITICSVGILVLKGGVRLFYIWGGGA